MTKAETIAKKYLNGEPVELIEMIPELLNNMKLMISSNNSASRRYWKRYIRHIERAIDHYLMVEKR